MKNNCFPIYYHCKTVYSSKMSYAAVLSNSIMSNSLPPHGLWPVRLLCPWHFPVKNTGVVCHFFLQGIFPTQGSNLSLLQVDAFPSEPQYNELPSQNTKKRASVLLSGKMI